MKMSFRSPTTKVIAFLNKSRENWRNKAKEYRAKIKVLNNKSSRMKDRSELQKEKIKNLQRELDRLRELIGKEMEKTEGEEEKKTKADFLPKAFSNPLPKHQYSSGEISFCLSNVLSCSISLRAAARIMTNVVEHFKLPIGTPSWFSIRLWLMRFGYYKLKCPVQKADD